MKKRSIVPCLLLFFVVCSVISAQTLTVREIMAEPSIAGMRVTGEKLSPDGSKVVYLWNAEGRMPLDIYISPTTRPTPSRLLGPRDLPPPAARTETENKLNYGLTVRDDFVKERENTIGNLEWSPDSKKLLFTQNGDLYVLTLGEAKPKRYTKTQSAEVAARFLDNNRIVFQQNGNLFVLDTVNSTLTQVSREANPANFITIFNVVPNKTGTLIAYVVVDNSKQKSLFVPNYLDELVTAPTFRRGWSEQKILVVQADGGRDTPFEIRLPKSEGTSFIRNIKWAADGSSLVVDRNDRDTKRRQLYYINDVGSKGEQTILLTEETDNKWVAPLSLLIEPHPKDPSQIVFASEKDGYNHLYLARLTPLKPEPNPTGEIRGGNPTDAGYSSDVKIEQLTKGPWQVEWAKWLADGGQLVYSSTQDGTAGREFFTLAPGTSTPFKALPVASPGNGMKTGPQLAEIGDQPTLLYEYSRWNMPGELYSVPVCTGCRGITPPERITKTVSESFASRKWSVPQFLNDIPTRDNRKVPAKIYLPAGFDKAKKYPMVIFVHGAGYLQNVIDGWNNYYREFLFNELLTQKGYVVLDIDYRGSAGYGRDWRTDVYDFLGGPDMDDHIDAIDYTVKNFSVNVNKIGVYGGSYGGFMAEMLVMRAPDKIAAAAALRPVSDWKNYYASSPVYTAQRLGFPDKNPEAYKRSSPIHYADKLERPLLILHGMVDDNVHAQDSIQLIEKLMRLGKTQYFEAMLYPAENHAFTRPSSWTDEYERILAFFEKHLK